MSALHGENGVTAYAPGSIGNFGPGLDVLGCAMSGGGDEVHARIIDAPDIIVEDSGHPRLTRNPLRHASAIAAREVMRRAGVRDFSLALRVKKGLPLSGGQGGSAASAVAGAVAANALIAAAGFNALDTHGLLASCLVSEAVVAGRHLDNIAPSLMGGVVVVRHLDPPDVARVPVNLPLWIALAHPEIAVRTAHARSVLPEMVEQQLFIDQLGSVAALVTALATGDIALLGRAMTDYYAEPAREALVPGFRLAKQAAIEAGAVGGSFSGSGPSTFMVCETEAIARASAEAMRWSYEASGVPCTARVATIDLEGARWRQA
jgi:homoserine kinase